jgi:hypothetical protein
VDPTLAELTQRTDRKTVLLLVVVVAFVAASLLAVGGAVGSSPRASDPPRLVIADSLPCWSDEPLPELQLQESMAIPDSNIRIRLPSVQRSMTNVQGAPGALGLGEAVNGLSYGRLAADQTKYVSTNARGILIAEVTEARSHGSLKGKRLGSDAATIVAGLRTVAGFSVLDPARDRLAGLPAVSAEVSTSGLEGWKHIDRRTSAGDLGCVADFTLPSRVTAVDVQGAVVLVQVWAADNEGLRQWLPTADGLLKRLQLSRE